MNTILEELKQLVTQLEQRVKALENKLYHVEKPLPSERTRPLVHDEPEIMRDAPAQQKIFDYKRFELNIGKYFLQVAGAGIFLIGMGFLLKYSLEQGFLSPWARVILGLITATGALGCAEYFRVRYKQWASGFSAGGIVLYYLSFYAAYNIHHLISLEQASICFMTTTMAAWLFAWWHDSFFIALFSAIGAFATPMLLHVSSFNQHLLMGYLLGLSLAYLLFSYAKQWFSLSLITFLLTVLYYAHFLIPVLIGNKRCFFIFAQWFIYAVIPYFYVFFMQPKKTKFESWLYALSTIFISIALVHILSNVLFAKDLIWPLNNIAQNLTTKELIKLVALVGGLVNTLLLVALYVRARTVTAFLATLYSLAITGFFIACITQWHGYVLIALLAIWSAALFYLSFVLKQATMRIYPYMIWVFMGCLSIIVLFEKPEYSSVIFNSINGSLLLVFVVYVLLSWLVEMYLNSFTTRECFVPSLVQGIACALPAYWMHTHIWHFPYHIIGLTIYSVVLFGAGVFFAKKLVRSMGYAFYLIALIYFGIEYSAKNLLNPYWHNELNGIFAAFVVGALCMLLAMEYMQKNLEKKELYYGIPCMRVVFAFLLGAWIRADIILYGDVLNMQGAFFTKRLMGYTVQDDYLVRQPLTDVMLTLFYALYAMAFIIVGLLYKIKEFRYIGLVASMIAIGKLWFIIMGMPETIQRIVAFLCVGILLMIISFFYQKMSKKIT